MLYFKWGRVFAHIGRILGQSVKKACRDLATLLAAQQEVHSTDQFSKHQFTVLHINRSLLQPGKVDVHTIVVPFYA
jgi:hypothetical protein